MGKNNIANWIKMMRKSGLDKKIPCLYRAGMRNTVVALVYFFVGALAGPMEVFLAAK